MRAVIYAALEWRHGYLRMTFRARRESGASAVFSGGAAAKNPDGPEPTIATW
jgi:hypothetical protein